MRRIHRSTKVTSDHTSNVLGAPFGFFPMTQSRNPMILAWSVVAIFLVVDVIWLPFGRLKFAPGTFVLILWIAAIPSAAYFTSTAVAYRLRYDKSVLGRSLAVFAEGALLLLRVSAFMIASGITGVTLSYLSASLGLPLRDAELAAIDKAIGFDWPAFLAFMNQFPVLSWALVTAYHTTGDELLVLFLFLSFARQSELLAKFLAVLAISELITGVVATLLPAEGAYAYYQPARYLFSQYTPHAGVWHLEALASLRNDAAPILDLTRISGLITFPSFHTTVALIIAWAVRDVRYIAIPVMLFNAAVIVSTLPEGGHHLVDLFAGGIIAAVSILIVQSYIGRTVSTSMSLTSIPTNAVKPDATAG
jgi:membrane-associated phospholipid phosphatase